MRRARANGPWQRLDMSENLPRPTAAHPFTSQMGATPCPGGRNDSQLQRGQDFCRRDRPFGPALGALRPRPGPLAHGDPKRTRPAGMEDVNEALTMLGKDS